MKPRLHPADAFIYDNMDAQVAAFLGTGYGHNGSSDLILSRSYDNNFGPLTPDNWLVTPAVTLCEGSTFSFWACGQDAS